MVHVDVVVPAYGDPTRLTRLLEALDQEAAGEPTVLGVVVSDDGSPVPLKDEIDPAGYQHIDLVHVRGPNGGPGAARNRGVRESAAEWIAFLDADTVPAPGWLSTLKSALQDAVGVDAFEGVVLVPDGASPFAHATQIQGEATHGGANIVYRRSAFDRLDGFSESFYDPERHMHFREDNDMYFRAVAQELTVKVLPELVALHPPLDSSFTTPMRLARRYYFDVLLDKRHHSAFQRLNRSRSVGPVSMRVARHWASNSHVGANVALGLGIATRSRRLTLSAGAVWLASWAANIMALTTGKEVRPSDAPGIAGAALATPWVYSYHYYRGVLTFRHLPRLR